VPVPAGGAVVGCAIVAATLGTFEELYRDADHTVAVAAPLLVQVRRGAMTFGVLDLVERKIQEVRARSTTFGASIGVVAVLEEGSPVVRDDVRVAQRRVVLGALEGLDARMAVIVVGEGLGSVLQRTVARGVAFASPRVRIVKTTDAAAAWIAPHVGVSAAEVRSVVDRARALR
jgi:hypothetical protein